MVSFPPLLINETKPAENINLFPNPAVGKFNDQSSECRVQNTTIEIYDLTGKKLVKKQIPTGNETQEIDTGNLNNGVYICRIIMDKGSVTKKLIIQK